jgi:hypothetical protein
MTSDVAAALTARPFDLELGAIQCQLDEGIAVAGFI